MVSRLITSITLLAFITSMLGCSSNMNLPLNDVKRPQEKVLAVTLLSGEAVVFNSLGGSFETKPGTIVGVTIDNQPIAIKSEEVRSVQVKRGDTRKTLLCIGGVLLLGFMGLVWLGTEIDKNVPG